MAVFDFAYVIENRCRVSVEILRSAAIRRDSPI